MLKKQNQFMNEKKSTSNEKKAVTLALPNVANNQAGLMGLKRTQTISAANKRRASTGIINSPPMQEKISSINETTLPMK